MTVSSEASYRTMTRSVRRFRRAMGRGLPFFPYGLLPLIGLGLLTLIAWTTFARHSVEQVVRRTAEQVITDSGSNWADIRVSGQWVTVSGMPPTPEAGERLLEAIRKARAPTWLGAARPATRVRGDFGPRTVRPEQASTGVLAPEAGTVLLGAGQDPEFLFRLDGSQLTLDGRVPDLATRDAIVAAANSDLPDRITQVDNNLETMGTTPPQGFRDTALRGVKALKLCETGTASFTTLRFNLRCELLARDAGAVRELAGKPLTFGSVGDIQIISREDAESCEQELSRLIAAARIEFEPGSARIASSKTAVLDLTARAAADCPGSFRVEGHTDNTGSLQINQTLSLARAEAVRAALIQRGVSPDRLTATGYGPARPLGSNATAEGRALNRRIEISIVRPGE